MGRPRLKVCVVGAGYFARFHLDAWHRIPNVDLAGLADTDTVKAETAATSVGSPPVFADINTMIATIKPDLIDLATPPPTHAILVRTAVDAGIPVVCQKPFCTSFAEAQAIVDYAAAKGIPLIIHENFRFEPWHRRIKALLETGTLGDVYNVTFRLRPGDGQGPNAYLSRQPYFQKMPRFLIRETGIHFIDVFRYLVGEVEGVSADLRRLNPAIAGEDAGHILFHFSNGARGLFDGNRLVDHPANDRRLTMGEMLIEGSEAAIRLDGYGRIYLRHLGANEENELNFHWEDRGYGGDCVKFCLEHVAQHFLTGTPLENTGRDYLKNLQIEDAIYRSAAEKRYIPLT